MESFRLRSLSLSFIGSMAPNKYFHKLKQTIEAAIRYIPCPACDRRLGSRSGFTRHLNTRHPDIKEHPRCDFVWTTSKISDVYTYNVDSTDDDNSPTDNNEDPPSPSYNVPSVPPYSPTRLASPENGIVEDLEEMDVDPDFDNENDDASSSSNIPHPASSNRSHSRANRSNAARQTGPEKKYTRIYHPKLDGKCSLHLC